MDESRFDESQLNTANKVCSLDEAIGFVQAGDCLLYTSDAADE